MTSQTFILNPTRTAKQGAQINVGKESEEYKRIVTTLTASQHDMELLGVEKGDFVRVSTEHGSAEFVIEPGKVPNGLLFVPYGPPTCLLMGGDTDGTGMPTSKGWDVQVEPIGKNLEGDAAEQTDG